MASFNRPQVRRGPSGAWSRLRTLPVDPLEAYGLPSKGETRLSDPKAQEAYFETIVSRYMRFCAACGTGEKLEEAFASFNHNGSPGLDTSVILPSRSDLRGEAAAAASGGRPSLASSNTCPTPIPQSQQQAGRQASSTLPVRPKPPPSAQQPSTTPTTCTRPPANELPLLLMAMRKLREGIVSLKRTDSFAQRVYIFIVRTTIHPFQHYESYHPSLLYLLHKIHPMTPLTPAELQEFASYLILDLACRQGDMHEAYNLKRLYKINDWKVEGVLKAVVRDDCISFWRLRRQVDGAMRVLMSWKETELRRHALACLGRAYLSADKGFVERCTDREWGTLVKEDKVGWVLEGNGVVTIRKIKAK